MPLAVMRAWRNSFISSAWDIIDLVGVCMLSTRLGGGLRARPLESRPDRDAGIIWFVTDLHSAKEYEIESDNDVGLAFIDAKADASLSITARAEVWRDHAKATEIWKPPDNNRGGTGVGTIRYRRQRAEH